ncbi:hypothetical protein ADM96_34135 [Burkholderia sp. ST111]|nr:hypothetical protein ADM96_34135 [Burkholderia sp. ST111]
MEAVRFRPQSVALSCLNAPESISERAVGIAVLDAPGNRAGFLVEHDVDVLRESIWSRYSATLRSPYS